MSGTVIIIPARLASRRFPRKMLAPLAGMSLIRRSFLAASAARGVDEVFVATDSEEIARDVEGIGARVVMTDETPRNGTERVAQALERMELRPDLVVNFQGDAPLTPPWFVEELIAAAVKHPEADMLTPVLRCSPRALESLLADRREGRVGATTAVFDRSGRALYFSKEVIPHGATPRDEPVEVFHHVGLYAYRPQALRRYMALPQGRLERLEGLEQLRFLENGLHIQAVEVDARGRTFWEVNNPQDIPLVEAALAEQGA